MATALSYIHNNNIAHNDFKLENVLCFLTENNDICFQLSDFGFAYNIEAEKDADLKMGHWRNRTNTYFSPKINSQIISKKFTDSCERQGDIFSLGYSLFLILYQRKLTQRLEHVGDSPFYQKMMEHGKSFIQFKLKSKVTMPEDEMDSCLDLMLKMLHNDDSQRIQADDILNHPFLSL